MCTTYWKERERRQKPHRHTYKPNKCTTHKIVVVVMIYANWVYVFCCCCRWSFERFWICSYDFSRCSGRSSMISVGMRKRILLLLILPLFLLLNIIWTLCCGHFVWFLSKLVKSLVLWLWMNVCEWVCVLCVWQCINYSRFSTHTRTSLSLSLFFFAFCQCLPESIGMKKKRSSSEYFSLNFCTYSM